MNRAPDTQVSRLLMGMSRKDRIRLDETVRLFITEVDSSKFKFNGLDVDKISKFTSGSSAPAATPAPDAPAPEITTEVLTSSPVGSKLLDKVKQAVFKKTGQGWLALVSIPLKKVLELVKPDGRESVSDTFNGAAENEKVWITKGLLIDPDIANETGGLRFIKTEGGKFKDPNPITPVMLAPIANDLKLNLVKPDGENASVAADANKVFLEDIEFKFTAQPAGSEKGVLTITVDLKGGFDAFDRLFGSAAQVGRKVAKAVATREGSDIPFDISYDPKQGGDAVLKNLTGLLSSTLRFKYDPTAMNAKFKKNISSETWQKIKAQIGGKK